MAKLFVETLTCVTTSDGVDADEPEIVLEGKGAVWRGKVLKGQTCHVDYICGFTGWIGVLLAEADDPGRDDSPGNKWITEEPGIYTLHFQGDGAAYTLEYSVA
ncbi:hypothetical protein [Streptomyces gilvosporeus]|uniref:Uncharacterized protein n=1 Tax=Streptomyces gilvosporeus TaxID=553510 RepID=A0A1V0U1J8_9ACTN|nr:hypothetical protein [Streptomyces gilvosporeus]ARF59017.1 hypothetical protein B1H19_36870 [Streptomyces gilvosporeus]